MTSTMHSSRSSGLFPCSDHFLPRYNDFPLLSAKVDYDLLDVQILGSLTQTYTSTALIDVEICYVFPLPPDASVCAFKAVIDGERKIEGVVKEKTTAKAEYDQAVFQGKTAALLEQGNVEIFKVSLGNIKPKQMIEVHISFVSVISHDGSLDSLRLTFPTAIAPRYGTPPSGVGMSGAGSSKNTLEFSVAIEMASQILSITSPSHPIAMKLGGSTLEPTNAFDPMKAHVSLSSPALLEKDIVLVLTCKGLDKPRCMVESFSLGEGGQEYTDAYALTLVPRFKLPLLPAQEYIFLVDRSGSMARGKMAMVRSALQILLMSLPSEGTFFNIISFGKSYSKLWPSSVEYTTSSVKEASKYVDSMTANYGGTEIRNAIEAAFASRGARPNSETKSSAVFILTDGDAYDLDGVQSSIQDAVAQAKKEGLLLRTFCMGIGNAVSKAMCDVIARAGQGTAAFVGEEEKPDLKLMEMLRAARSAVVQDISIDWGVDDASETDVQDFEMVPPQYSQRDAAPISPFDELSLTSSETMALGPWARDLFPTPRVQQAPSTNSLPPFYPGFRTSLFAIARRRGAEKTTVPKNVRIKGFVLGQPVVLEVPVTVSQEFISEPKKPTQIKMLHCLAARALMQSIEDKAATNMREVDKAEVLRLAIRYGLASSQTSFIAVDEQGKFVDAVRDIVKTPTVEPEAMRLAYCAYMGDPVRRSNSQTQSKKGGSNTGHLIDGVVNASPPPMSMKSKTRPVSYTPGSFPRSGGLSMRFPRPRNIFSLFKKPEIPLSVGSPIPSTTTTSLSPTVETFARAQSFDGSFTGSASLFQLLFQQSNAPTIPAALGTAGARGETLWCTVLCITYLETKLGNDKDIWTILVEKAMKFVKDTLQDMGMHDVSESMRNLKQDARRCTP